MTREVRDGRPERRLRQRVLIALKEQVPLTTMVPTLETPEHPLEIAADAGAATLHLGSNDPDLHAAHRTAFPERVISNQ